MINSISLMSPMQVNETPTKTAMTSSEVQQNFANTLKDAIAKVNDQQIQSDAATNKLINGENIELH
ncbi:MAG: flagellar hook-basal body complex protein FliE, partial [Lysinibacillus sp.]